MKKHDVKKIQQKKGITVQPNVPHYKAQKRRNVVKTFIRRRIFTG